VKEDLREIGVRVRGKHPRAARRHVHGHERRLVAVARVVEVERLAVAAEVQESGRVDLAGSNGHEGHPGPVRPVLEYLDTAVLEVARSEPQLKRAIRTEPGEPVVLELEHRFPGDEVDAVDVKNCFSRSL
jgi:hypothetical protein